jgi:hypothetical protein
MTSIKPTSDHHLRLTARFVVYDPGRGLLLWREWPEGAVVTDPDDIALLEARGAPVERIQFQTNNGERR